MAAQAADDKKGEQISILDVRGQSSVADCFLFVTGTSHIHIRALEDTIREELRKEGASLLRTDGQRGHLWRALDYGSMIVHIMDAKTRHFYSLENLWERAKPIKWSAEAPLPVKPKVKAKAKTSASKSAKSAKKPKRKIKKKK